jgi:hypothetical protein
MAPSMIDEPHVGFTPASFLPPGLLLWVGMYTAMFYVCGGMIAALYDPD